MPTHQQYKYDAFISYRRQDGKRAAAWLRNRIQRYRLPKSFRKKSKRSYPDRLRVYLDTEYEIATGNFYESTIKPALLESKDLVLVITPSVLELDAESDENWVAREYRDFFLVLFIENVTAHLNKTLACSGG